MAFKHDDVINAQFENLQAQRAEIGRDYEAARLSEDSDMVMHHANRYLQVEQQLAALDRIAGNWAGQQQQLRQQQQYNPYGLTKDEMDVARTIDGGNPKLSDADRQRIYAENRARLQQMRRDGTYRDDQGTVRR